MPMNVNEQVIRPLLGFASTVALFLIPMITMRLFAESSSVRSNHCKECVYAVLSVS